MTKKEIIFHHGQNIEVKEGYQALVKFVKLKATPIEVCKKLKDLELTNLRLGDLKDIQRLAKVAYYEHIGLELEDEGRAGHSTEPRENQRHLDGDKSRDSDVES